MARRAGGFDDEVEPGDVEITGADEAAGDRRQAVCKAAEVCRFQR
jgi:hypothetical protein